MNRTFSTLWNSNMGRWVVASEHATRRGKRGVAAKRLTGLASLGLSLTLLAPASV